jgi:hypothetical protein
LSDGVGCRWDEKKVVDEVEGEGIYISWQAAASALVESEFGAPK